MTAHDAPAPTGPVSPDLLYRASLPLVAVDVRCMCRCLCHTRPGRTAPEACFRIIEPGDRDCSAGCRSDSGACEPFQREKRP